MEKKGKIAILSHFELGDCLNHTPLIRFLCSQYQEVVWIIKDNNSIRRNIPIFIEDCKNVVLHYVTIKVPNFYHNQGEFVDIINTFAEKGYEIRLAGNFTALINKSLHLSEMPFCFYDDIGVSRDIFWKNMRIPRTSKSVDLHSLIKDQPYYVISPQSSWGRSFTPEQAQKVFNINSDKTLMLCFDYNIYPESHHFHELANNFVMQPIVDYVHTLEAADGILLENSCILCLALHLNLKTEYCYNTIRFYRFDNYLYKSEYGYDESKKWNKLKSLTFYF